MFQASLVAQLVKNSLAMQELLLLLLSHFSRVLLWATPETAAHPSLWLGCKNLGVGCHFLLQCMKVKSEVAQLCQTLSDPMDCSLPGSSVHGIFQAGVLEWGAIAFSRQCRRPQFNSWVGKIPWRRDRLPTPVFLGFPGGSDIKESTYNAAGRPGFHPWVGKIPWSKAWQSTPVFLPGESPWTEEPDRLPSIGSQESDTTEPLSTAVIQVMKSLEKQIHLLLVMQIKPNSICMEFV